MTVKEWDTQFQREIQEYMDKSEAKRLASFKKKEQRKEEGKTNENTH